MKQVASYTLIAITLAGLSGCSWLGGDKGYFRDRGSDYLEAQQGTPMQLPQGVQTKRLDPLMPIPSHVNNSDEQGKFVVPRATGSFEPQFEVADYSINKSGQSQWIVAQRIPAQVWSRIIDYFTSQGFQVQSESPQIGELVMQWQALDQVTPALAARFGAAAKDLEAQVLIRVEPGVQRNTSEIFLTSEVRPSASGSANAELTHGSLDVTLLEALRTHLAQTHAEQETVSLLATSRQFDAPQRVHLNQTSSEVVLVLDTSFDRAWSSVGRAIEHAGIAIEDLNRSANQYEINLAATPKQEKRGWFKRTFTRDPAKIKPELYQLVLTPVGRQVEVRVMQNDAPVTIRTSQKILERLEASLN